MNKNLTIIIPAAGVGRRMKSYGAKPLIELKNRETILDKQLRIIKSEYPGAEIIVVVGFQADKIIKGIPKGIKVVENELYEQNNVVRSIGMGLRVASNNNVMVIYGDVVFNIEAIRSVHFKDSTIVVDSQQQISNEEVGVTVVNNEVVNFSYGLPMKWAQILFIKDKELDLFKKLVYDKDKYRLHTFEVLNSLIDQGGSLKAVEPKALKIVEIDSYKDIEIANTI